MTGFLTHLGALSLGGAAAALLLWGTSRFTRSRYAARWRCWGWLLLCLRLAAPLPLPALPVQGAAPIRLPAPSDAVIYRPGPPPAAPPPPPRHGGAHPPPPAVPGTPRPAVSQPPAEPEPSPLTLSRLLTGVWLAGAAAVLLYQLWCHIRFVRYVRRWSETVSDPETLAVFRALGRQLGISRLPRLTVCQGLEVPMLAGVLRPVLLLPRRELDPDELRYSLLHELIHCRRRDIPFKALSLWVAALHWFNPVMWLLGRWVERDTELACDDAALRRLPPGEHAAYGRTILSAVERLKGEAS